MGDKMAPLPENNTARIFIRYTSLGQEHEAILRLGAAGTTAEAGAIYSQFAPLIAALLPSSDAVLGARFQGAGSNVSFPLAGANPVNGSGVTPDTDNQPEFVSFTGRSSDGRRVKFTVFSPQWDPDTQGYRDIAPTGPWLDLLNALRFPDATITTISGGTPLWNSYMNRGYNAYFQRKLRRTSS